MADPRLLIVTGKGGVGKTTVTAAIGRATSRAGLRTLLVETASPGRLANVLRVPALEAEPRRVDERLDAVSLDADAALASFVATLLPLRMLSNALMGSDTFRIVAAALPGIAEAALLSQVLAWLEPRGLRRAAWDRIVLDAPASGHSAPLLSKMKSEFQLQ
ncbi:MAG: ArsA family ATPase [Alphaproteobacteria bacterium]